MKKTIILLSCFFLIACSKIDYSIAAVYEKGYFWTPEYSTLIALYTKAAEQGSPSAQTWLAYSYTSTKDSPGYNLAKGISWATKAAEQGYYPAMFFLSGAYRSGHGVKQDNVIYYKWFYLSKLHGNKFAEINDTTIQSQLSPEEVASGKKMALEWQKAHGYP